MTQAVQGKKKRPAVITIVALFILLSAVLNMGGGALLVWAGYLGETGNPEILHELATGDPDFADPETVLVIGIETLVIGVVELVIFFGFLGVKEWAWTAAISWQALSLLLELAHYFQGTVNPLALGLAVLLVFILNQSEVRRQFGVIKSTNEFSNKSSISSAN